MRFLHLFIIVGGLSLLQGCAAVALSAGSMGAGLGIDHTLAGISTKTFAASGKELRLATLYTLKRLDMPVTVDEKTAMGHKVHASAHDRRIEIEMETLTRRSTRMSVVAHQGEIFFKDAATSTELIIQIAHNLDMLIARRAAKRQAASYQAGGR